MKILIPKKVINNLKNNKIIIIISKLIIKTKIKIFKMA